jgi:hypothetical protein
MGKIRNMEGFIRTIAPEGCIVEIGVHLGGSFTYLANADENRAIIGYDTFEGIPYHSEFDDKIFFKGSLGVPLSSATEWITPRVKHNKWTLVKGVYPESDSLKPKPIALAHIDVDVYRSVHDCLSYLPEFMASGGRIYLDDPYEPKLDGATKALLEWCEKTGMEYNVDAVDVSFKYKDSLRKHTYIQF